MLGKHQKPYGDFYRSTHDNEHLDTKTELLVGLSAAMAMNCLPCTNYYLKQAKRAGITKGEISDVTAKVMAVAAGQKKLQFQEVLEKYNIDPEKFA
ncbi:carboxymuconolactone decarboxylase family protein [Vibrio sp. WXL103]|uniref:carboxymuconolactone decarboxylase family protein n=1 Tax=Vibrio sp. WXL103 TaxID=3450710 RepID=UPI003EC514AE